MSADPSISASGTEPGAQPSTAPGTQPGQPTPADSAAPSHPPRPAGPRTGPIVWGALLLVFCGYVAQRAFGGELLDPTEWLIVTTLGLGALLLGVGVVVVLKNRRR